MLIRTLMLVAALAAPGVAAAAESPFWGYWSDGKAELSGYSLVQPRYGEARAKAYAVLVFVTEPFSRSRGVKVDRYDRDNPDHTTVLKLNHVRKFQTGIYDYSVMTSVFADPAAGFKPLKISFSGQEWCGHVFEELLFGDGAKHMLNSYFEGESTRGTIGGATEELRGLDSEDSLFIQLRGLAADALERKDSEGFRLDSALHRRLAHKPATPHKMKVEWASKAASTQVPAGTFETWAASWTRAEGTRCTADIEVAYPHKIIGWRCTDGEVAKLTGTMRAPYWSQHNEGDEKLLEKLGLRVP